VAAGFTWSLSGTRRGTGSWSTTTAGRWTGARTCAPPHRSSRCV